MKLQRQTVCVREIGDVFVHVILTFCRCHEKKSWLLYMSVAAAISAPCGSCCSLRRLLIIDAAGAAVCCWQPSIADHSLSVLPSFIQQAGCSLRLEHCVKRFDRQAVVN